MPSDAPGTLRQAVFDANSLPGPHVIQFQVGLSGTIDLSSIGDAALGPSALLISSEITIQGNASGITIGRHPAAPEMRLFRIAANGTLELDSIMLADGIARGINGTTGGPNGGEGQGGAIYNEGTLEVVASTMNANQAIGGNAAAGGNGGSGRGAAIYNNAGDVSIINATLSTNSALSGSGGSPFASFGGGVYSRNGSLSIHNSTITGNSAGGGRGVYILAIDGTATAEVYSSIIGQADVPLGFDFVAIDDTGGAIAVTGADNLIRSQNNFHEITIEGPVDPLLGPLMNNGGPTLTHALSSGSQAIDKGANPQSLTTDQRGQSYTRVIGGQADIGAFELQTAVGPELPGDYNGNHVVDAADYVLWRKTLGTEVPMFSGADGSGNGAIDPVDYSVWRQNFGDTGAAAAAFDISREESSVDEPSAAQTALAELPPPAGIRPLANNREAVVSRVPNTRSALNLAWLESFVAAHPLASEIDQKPPTSEQARSATSERTSGAGDLVLDHVWSSWPKFFDFDVADF